MPSKQPFIFLILFIINLLLFFFFSLTKSYPFFAILLNILSVVFFLCWISFHALSIFRQNKKIIDIAIIICLFLLAFVVYIYKIDIVTPGIQGDEITVAKISEQILTSTQFAPFTIQSYGHPTPLLYLTGWSIQTFGRTIMAIRLPYVLFGALSIAAFYVLLRMFFTKTISIAGSLLMLFSYPFIILSRLAYEVTPEIFFQIVTVISLTLAWKKKDILYYAAVGLSLGLGLYTYVGFRTFALLILFILAYLLIKTAKTTKSKILYCTVTLAALFIPLIPLLSYSINNPTQIMARTTALSAFTQNYSSTETTKEIFANIGRLTHLFFMGDPNSSTNGDTNYARNPSNVSMFDIGTFLLFIMGIFFFFRTNRKLLLIITILTLSAIANDIFVIEKIPQAVNPYGVGHPNTLRIAGIIPIIYFVIVYGLNQIRVLLEKRNINIFYGTYVLLAILALYNWSLYFNQPSNTFFSNYIDDYNKVFEMDIVNAINASNAHEVAVSAKFATDERFKYFINKNIVIKSYAPKSYSDAVNQARAHQLSVLDPMYNTTLAIQLLSQEQPNGVQITHLSKSAIDPDHTIYAIFLIH